MDYWKNNMELFTTVNEIDIYFSFFEDGTTFLKTSAKYTKKYKTCPFCGELITEGPIFLLFNNWKLFPNVVVHKECIDKYSTKEEAMIFLFEDYQEALKHKHWFNID
jgi:hypothetical protein